MTMTAELPFPCDTNQHKCFVQNEVHDKFFPSFFFFLLSLFFIPRRTLLLRVLLTSIDGSGLRVGLLPLFRAAKNAECVGTLGSVPN